MKREPKGSAEKPIDTEKGECMESVRDRRAIGDLRQYISFSIGEEEYGLSS